MDMLMEVGDEVVVTVAGKVRWVTSDSFCVGQHTFERNAPDITDLRKVIKYFKPGDRVVPLTDDRYEYLIVKDGYVVTKHTSQEMLYRHFKSEDDFDSEAFRLA